jgi:serine/threonine-protein kinase
MNPTTLVEGQILAQRYRLERPLGSGGMGCVWVASHLLLDIPVAVKFIDPALAGLPEVHRRFEREAKAAARLRSAHVVRILDRGAPGETPYLVMELLEGEDLGARLKREQRMPLDAVAALIMELTKGLVCAHEAGIIHRDLKPANVFLARVDGGEVAKILDFGLAKAIGGPGGDATKTGLVMGSPSYMSPEQARARSDIDHRTDLWSLAAVAFRALTGRPPFVGDSDTDIVVKVCTENAPPPSALVPDLPQALDAFFAKALARDPGQRFSSAPEMAAALFEVAVRANAPSHTLMGVPVAPAAPAPEPAIEEEMVKTALLPAGAGKTVPLSPDKTLPLPSDPPVDVVAERDDISVPAAAPAVSPRSSSSWAVWAAGAGFAGALVIAAVAVFAARGRSGAEVPPGTGSAASASRVETPAAAEPAAAVAVAPSEAVVGSAGEPPVVEAPPGSASARAPAPGSTLRDAGPPSRAASVASARPKAAPIPAATPSAKADDHQLETVR